MSPTCKCCGKPVTKDETAATKKLINRGATEYLCIPCLARHFDVAEEAIRERIAYFKAMGCTLFE
ncbi:MAG: hypothetical protein IJ438_08215 [Clostridia bacterium]|nr:hypothetical protein [Clostridia bacterium]